MLYILPAEIVTYLMLRRLMIYCLILVELYSHFVAVTFRISLFDTRGTRIEIFGKVVKSNPSNITLKI